VSAKVWQHDLAKSRVAECQQWVHDLIDLNPILSCIVFCVFCVGERKGPAAGPGEEPGGGVSAASPRPNRPEAYTILYCFLCR
jgi:hypothetical protein